jgi:hypothetical protein
MGHLVKIIGSGIGFTSEAIHAARSRSSNKNSSSASTPRNASIQESGDDAQYAVVDDETADALVRDGRAELVGEKNGGEAVYELEGDESLQQGDEAVWELDEAAQDVKLPTYDESEARDATAAAAQPESYEVTEQATEEATEEVKEEREKDMVQSLVKMAGPVQATQPIPCPVIIPQRRPGQKDRGFVRAYAPVLDTCGISQDVFVRFLKNFDQASKVCLTTSPPSSSSLITHI